MKSPAALAAACLLSVSCAAVVSAPPPTEADVRQAEDWHINVPSPTMTPGKYIVEFPTEVEVRSSVCSPSPDGSFTCRYERRIRAMVDPAFGPWEAHMTRLILNRYGNWVIDDALP